MLHNWSIRTTLTAVGLSFVVLTAVVGGLGLVALNPDRRGVQRDRRRRPAGDPLAERHLVLPAAHARGARSGARADRVRQRRGDAERAEPRAGALRAVGAELAGVPGGQEARHRQRPARRGQHAPRRAEDRGRRRVRGDQGRRHRRLPRDRRCADQPDVRGLRRHGGEPDGRAREARGQPSREHPVSDLADDHLHRDRDRHRACRW